jgi:hypothetical protein
MNKCIYPFQENRSSLENALSAHSEMFPVDDDLAVGGMMGHIKTVDFFTFGGNPMLWYIFSNCKQNVKG